MNIESNTINGIHFKILYIDNLEIYLEIHKEIDIKNRCKKFDLNYDPNRKLVFGLDFAADLFFKNKELLSELQDYYYYGQINNKKGIILVKL